MTVQQLQLQLQLQLPLPLRLQVTVTSRGTGTDTDTDTRTVTLTVTATVTLTIKFTSKIEVKVEVKVRVRVRARVSESERESQGACVRWCRCLVVCPCLVRVALCGGGDSDCFWRLGTLRGARQTPCVCHTAHSFPKGLHPPLSPVAPAFLPPLGVSQTWVPRRSSHQAATTLLVRSHQGSGVSFTLCQPGRPLKRTWANILGTAPQGLATFHQPCASLNTSSRCWPPLSPS